MKYLKLTAAMLAVVMLNGCLEVEDKDNSDIQALIDNQTDTLAESREVSIKGLVVDALDLKPISNALITVKVGSTIIIENFETLDGDFELTGLPQYSDIEIIISSTDNSFLSRTFFAHTNFASSEGIDDMGSFPVSESVDIEISVIDNETNSAYPNLEFIGYSHSGTGSSAYKYQHVSTFNKESGLYTITLPKFIDTSISANLDFDKDGEIDHIPQVNGFLRGRDLYLSSANTKEFTTIYLSEVEAASALEIRLSLVDEMAQVITDASFYIADNMVESSYDEVSNQYVISTKLKDTVTIQLPAFTSNEVKYQSTAFTVSKLTDGNLKISINGIYNNCCFTIPNTEVIDFALSPQVILGSETPLKVVLTSEKVDPNNDSFSAFYSQSIEVKAENISLVNPQGFTVVKGSDNENDLILPGTTVINGGLFEPVTFLLSLNDTRLTVTPSNPLIAGESYKYDVGAVTNKESQETDNIANDELTFEVDYVVDEVFDITHIKLDNENFTTHGNAITASNSAGEAANPVNYYNNVSFYLPSSINALQNLTLRQVSYIKNGIASVAIETYQLVVDGDLSVTAVGIVNLANNETYTSENNHRTVVVSSAQAETQKTYRRNTWEYFADNTDLEANTISFEYSFETKAGEISTGNITIPVQ